MQNVRYMQGLGETIRRERKSKGMSQEELAELANVGINFVSQVERGKETAEIGKVLHLVQLLGLSLVVGKREEWARISRYIEQNPEL